MSIPAIISQWAKIVDQITQTQNAVLNIFAFVLDVSERITCCLIAQCKPAQTVSWPAIALDQQLTLTKL